MAITLDRTDRRLLSILAQDGRLTNQGLADLVGLSPSACLRRVRRLEESGVIDGYAALLSPAAVGAARSVYVEVTLERQHAATIERFERAVAGCPGLRSAHLMAGGADYLLRIDVADVDGYEQLHREFLTDLPDVARIRSTFALRTIVDRPGPLPPAPGSDIMGTCRC
ncbi:MAG: Lrp/AsnC family transcriptional regulator [Euzebya sp.]